MSTQSRTFSSSNLTLMTFQFIPFCCPLKLHFKKHSVYSILFDCDPCFHLMNNWNIASHIEFLSKSLQLTRRRRWNKAKLKKKERKSLHVSSEFSINLHNHRDLWLCWCWGRWRRVRVEKGKIDSKWPFIFCTMYDGDHRTIRTFFHPHKPSDSFLEFHFTQPWTQSGIESMQHARKWKHWNFRQARVGFLNNYGHYGKLCVNFSRCLDQMSPFTWSIFHYLIFQFLKWTGRESSNLRQILYSKK